MATIDRVAFGPTHRHEVEALLGCTYGPYGVARLISNQVYGVNDPEQTYALPDGRIARIKDNRISYSTVIIYTDRAEYDAAKRALWAHETGPETGRQFTGRA